MRVEGENAKDYRAVRLDTLTNANKGELVMADDVTGAVKWKALDGTVASHTFGQHSIRIISDKR